MTKDNYERCEECGAVLFKNVISEKTYCKMCGWSPDTQSDINEVSYIG